MQGLCPRLDHGGLTPRRSPFAAIRAGAIFGLVLWAGQVQAQIVIGNLWPKPRLNVLTPTGGKAGTTFEVGFAGTELEEPQSLYFSHPGIKAVPLIPPPPKIDTKDKVDPKKPAPPPPPVTKFSVTIDKDVPPGLYDVRFVGKHGISNPRVFEVGLLNEVAEKEPNNDVEQAQKVEIGTTINGTISAPTDVDYCSFAGKKGQRVLIHCLCASLDSRLHPEMDLIDPSGRKIANHRPEPERDGLLDATLPADGDYAVRLVHFTYTLGGPEYFYRLSISTAPYVDAVFPPMIEPGKTASVTLYGRNLPGGQPDQAAVLDRQVLDKLVVKVTAPNDPGAAQRLAYGGRVSPVGITLDGFEYRLQAPAGPSNPSLITYAKAPVVIENDNNDTPETAQELPVPCEVAGRIDRKGDRDWYVIHCKKGDTYIFELFSHRLGAPTMMYVKIRNQAAKPPQDIIVLDDNPETLSTKGLYSVTRDPPTYKFTAPADGKYHVFVASHLSDNLADPTHIYRLRISPEKPDFRLIVMATEDYRPDAGLVGQGGQETYTVFAARQDGFKGDILLTMEGLPPGVTCPPQVLSANMKSTHLVVTAADNAAPFTGEVKVSGSAVIAGQKVLREARPASITWPTQPQQNVPTITRLDRSLVLAVRDKAPARLIAEPDKAVVSLGDKLNLKLKLQRVAVDFKGNFQVTPVPGELPAGITFGNLLFAPGKDDQTAVMAVAANTPPGTYNVVFRGFAPISPGPKAKPVNTILPSTPVQVTVLPKQVANLTVDNANPTVKLGMDGVVLVRVARLFEYNDPFKVQLVMPPGVTGVTADEITVPAGASEAKLTLRVPANTPPGPRPNITIRALAVVNGNVTLTHETKINVNVVK
jgi:hypothetical protein